MLISTLGYMTLIYFGLLALSVIGTLVLYCCCYS